jgi:hypothetical protein
MLKGAISFYRQQCRLRGHGYAARQKQEGRKITIGGKSKALLSYIMVSNTKMRAKINRTRERVADFGIAVPIWDANGRGYGS